MTRVAGEIEVKNLTKKFKLPVDKPNSLRNRALTLGKLNLREFVALEDVDFDIKKGEFVGIVGKNGSGKSTLLKLIAGIYQPSYGKIRVSGRLIPFIELGVGFNLELTGRENVYLNATLMGLSKKAIDQLYDRIVEFAELEDFMEQKLKNYSSGMQVRLAFSIAIRADADILLIDEVLAVGDSSFQQKCLDYFQSVRQTDTTIILVTHDMNIVEQFCDRAILIDQGKISRTGSPREISLSYQALNFGSLLERKNIKGIKHLGGEYFYFTSLKLINSKDGQTISLEDDLIIEISFNTKLKIEDPIFGIGIFDNNGNYLLGPNSSEQTNQFNLNKAKGTLRVNFGANNLMPGLYKISVSCHSRDGRKIYDHIDNFSLIRIEGKPGWGSIRVKPSWELLNQDELKK
ncbi:ABC transporter ATP-binding protein [Candidatus Saccharibacteria bacterium]|nr:ABC transporter ATP-binding protein [Candidatus Saccharibacteria bacterium]